MCVVSFSFVNTDLRTVYRTRFPHAEWILMDVSEQEASKRINERKGHFYKGVKPREEIGKESVSITQDRTEESNAETEECCNNNWKFAEVDFFHEVLDGKDAVETNGDKIFELIRLRLEQH